MSEEASPTFVTCSACGQQNDEEQAITDINFEFQGKTPLLVVYYRCLCCGHEWTDAHEPLNRPD